MLKYNPDLAVFCDLDGVIRENNRSIGDDSLYYVTNIDQIQFRPGALDALRLLEAHNVLTVVISNQEAVGYGKLSLPKLREMTDWMDEKIAFAGGHVSAWYYCIHRHEDECECRKPKIGLLHNIFHDHYLWELGSYNEDYDTWEYEHIWMIGDNHTDIECGKNAGLKTAHIRLQHCPEEDKIVEADLWGCSLLEVTERILGLVGCRHVIQPLQL